MHFQSAPRPLVLFIHGLGGDGASTWGDFPDLLSKDADLQGKIDVAFYQYPTRIIRWPFQNKSVRIQDLGKSIRTEIDVRYPEYKDVILVCHSMGGIIAQKYLVDELKEKRALRVRGLVLYAVPHTGADLARWGGLVSWRHWHLKQLRKGSDLLESIRQDWKLLGCDTALKAIAVFGGQDAIVSNNEGPDTEPFFIPEKNHLDIVKPKSSTDLSYLILKQFIADLFHIPIASVETTIPASTNTRLAISPPSRPPVLFDIYQPEYEPYYLHRREDFLLAGYLSMQNVWLHGPSGYGKTAALTRAFAQKGAYRLIPLGHYLGANAKGVCCGMHDALLNDRDARADVDSLAWPELTLAIVRLLEHRWADGNRWILVEEMPLQNELEFREYFSHLCAMLMLYAKRNPTKPITFAFSSVNDPRVGLDDLHRMAELLKVISFASWRQIDAETLVNNIAKGTEINLSTPDFDRLLANAHGSPRFIKMFFRNFINIARYNVELANTFDEAIAATRAEIPQ